MATPATAAGCSSCGALYSPSPGDRGLCTACRRLLPSQPPWRAGEGNDDEAGEASGGGSALSLSFLRGRSFRRIAIGGGIALVIGGLGAWVATHRHMVPDAWMAVRSRVPFLAHQAERGPSSSPGAAPSRGAARDMSAAAATLSRAQSQLEDGKTKSAEKMVKPLLRQKLPRGERAFAFRLMGAAEARQGHKRAAVAWYKKSLKVTDDQGERDRLARRIKQLSHAKTREDMSSAGGTP